MEIGFAFNSFSPVNNSEGKVSEASYWRPRKAKPSSAAANMLLWILFLFKLRYSTRNMDIRRFSPLRNIRIPKKDITTQKFVLIEINSDNRETYRRVDSKALGENRQLRL